MFAWRTATRLLIIVWFWSASAPLTAWAGPDVTLTLLDGSTKTGQLLGIGAEELEVSVEQGAEKIPVDKVMQVDFSQNPGEQAEAAAENQIFVTMTDQSALVLSQIGSDGTNATLSLTSASPATVPMRQIGDIRFSTLDDKVATRWEDLRTRNARDDLLVIRKGEVLDYVAGTIGKITPTNITMLVREKELAAPREKVFGIIFASRAASAAQRRTAVRTLQGDVIQAESIQMEESSLKVNSSALGAVTLPLTNVGSLDFGGGRIRFLADLPFDQSGSKSPQESEPVVWFVCRNAPSGSGGKLPLTIGAREFRKGLWLHSGSVLRFRLNREYTRLRSTAGFELTHVTRMPRFNPSVRLVVLGDGKEIYNHEFKWNDSPEQLDINLTDVRELTIRVDSAGAAQGILEHFALGDAQVIQ